jgi:drug/metabolite transporter, DME family
VSRTVRATTVRRGAVDVAAAAVLWGTAGTTQELLLPTAPPVAVAAVRCLLGGGLLLALALRASRRASLLTTLRTGGWPLWAATAAMTTFQATYLLGIRTAGVAIGTLVALGSAPAWAGLLAALGGRRPGRTWMVATATAVVGLVALVGGDTGRASATGVALAACAGAAYAGYATASSRLAVTDRSAVVAIVFVTCGLVLLPSVLVSGGPGSDAGAVVGLLWLAIGTTVVAYQLFLRGLLGVDAPTATTLSLLEPLTATLLAVAVVGERLAPIGLVGVVLLLAGVVGASWPARATRRPT